MQRLVLGLILLATARVVTGNATDISDAPLDISGVTAVAISGDASSVSITTAPDEPYRARLAGHRSGWFARWISGWAYDDCSAASRMSIEGTLLRIDVGQSTGFGTADCRYDINLNVRKQTAAAIDQQAMRANLSGDFSTLTVTAKAADISFSGHAETISLQSDALRAALVFKPAAQEDTELKEVVRIDAKMLEADLDFSAAPLLAYIVTAKAALVDTSRKSTAGGNPSLAITGDFVHATIR